MIIGGVRVDEEIDFKSIDEKVKFINAHKKYCEETIRELNTLIDIDYIKASEFIEGNFLEELKKVDIDEDTKIMRGLHSFIMDLPEDREERLTFINKIKYDSDNACLVVMKKGNANSMCKTYVCPTPKHLSAVEFALSRARKDRKLAQSGGGKMPLLDKKFIEEINARFFEKTEFKGEPGYGSYRRVYYKNGQWVLPDVYIKDTEVKVSKCENVPDDMEELIRFYNTSDLHPVLKAIIFKVRMIKIHPFCDGNGRTSRILLNYMLVRYGYPTLTIPNKWKEEYFEALDQAHLSYNYTKIIKLIMKCLDERCDKYIRVINEQMSQAEEIEKN